MNTKWAHATIEKVSTDRTITFIASHEKVDADGEVVEVDGIDLTRYDLNPVVLDQHQHQKVAVGRVVRRWKTIRDGAKALMCEAVFPDRPQSDEAYANVKSGLLSGVSIGFRSLETGPRTLPGQTGVTHTRTELTEISLVSIPSCPSCLIIGKACGCRVPPPDPSIARDEDDAVLILQDERVSPAARRVAKEAGRRAQQAVRRSLDSPVVLEIADEFDIDPNVVRAGTLAACVAWIAATAAKEATKAIRYAQGRVS